MVSPKKYKLEIGDKSPLGLIGILSDESDLKLSWLINKNIQVNLTRDEDLNWLSRELPNSLSFPIYSDPESKLGPVRLLKNRTLEGLWIKGYKQVDYLFLIMKENSQEEFNNLREKLQKISGIRGVYVLDPAPLQPWVE